MKLSLDELALADKILGSTRFYDEQIAMMLRGLHGAHRVLDLGIGFGNLAKKLVEEGKIVYGIDNNRHAIAYAKEKVGEVGPGHLALEELDAHLLHFTDEFDGASCLTNMGEFTNPKAVIQGTYRALKPGGVISITGVNSKDVEMYGSALESDVKKTLKEKDIKVGFLEKAKLFKLFNKVKPMMTGENPTEVVDMLQHAGYKIEERMDFYHATCYFLLGSKP